MRLMVHIRDWRNARIKWVQQAGTGATLELAVSVGPKILIHPVDPALLVLNWVDL